MTALDEQPDRKDVQFRKRVAGQIAACALDPQRVWKWCESLLGMRY
jgi:hypothetical protein